MTNTSTDSLPLLIEPEQLESQLEQESVLIIDLSKADNYNKYHIPGAVFLNYSDIVRIDKPTMGLIPSENDLSNSLEKLGVSNNTHIVAYDDEGGGKAARLLWTLDLLNHQNYSLLNGGIFSWANEGYPLNSDTVKPLTSSYKAQLNDNACATKEFILSKLDSDSSVFFDCRTPEEYQGIKKFAARGGHIPGAVNLDWVHTMNQNNNLRLKSKEELLELLSSLGISSDKEVITYCQTHHRSSHTYIVLKYLEFENIKGYPGAWSDWGNDPDTPIAT